ncbi:MAG: tyrosine-type recombinase/integrase [Bacteriovoracaceae bacterium]|jgi:site-specific recombinase XerD|nr:tyrosine-type recombinase/integrase [Bacteriovoracaceae bacterium]
MSKNELTTLVNKELAKKFKEASKKRAGIHDFIEHFLNQFISDQTKRAYLRDLNDYFNFLKTADVSITHPCQIEGHHFQFYRDDLIEKGLASATINRKLVAIRSFVKWSMALRLIEYNPLDVVKLPKVQTKDPTIAFDDEEVVRMIQSVDTSTKKGAMHKLVLTMLFSLGLRRSELCHIKIKDVFKQRSHVVLEIRGKGDKTRLLPLPNAVIHAITEYSSSMANFGVNFEPDDYLIQSSLKNKNIKPIDGSTIYRIVEKYAKLCEINKRVSPHSCRATAISHLLDTQKTPIRDVAIFAGHSSITTTQRYDKRTQNLDNSAAYDIDYTGKKTG